MASSAAQIPTIDLSDLTALGGDTLDALQRRVLPAYLMRHRWYGAKDAGAPAVTVLDRPALDTAEGPVLLATLLVRPPGCAEQRYFLPLAVVGEDQADAGDPAILAKVPQGFLIDAFARNTFVNALVEGMREGRETGGLRFRQSGGDLDDVEPIERSRTEQSNTSIRIGGKAMLKGFRKLEQGTHPELEVGRFLTEVAKFPNSPALLGSIERVGEDGGGATALCVVQALVPDAEDAWGYVLERTRTPADPELLKLVGKLGQRTAEMHHAMAAPSDDPAFRPEPVTQATVHEWVEAVRTMARKTLDSLERALPKLGPDVRPKAESLLARREELIRRFDDLAPKGLEVCRTRLHGDYHLGQVLVSRGDFFIIDFEGEPMRPLAERRAKHSPLRDVAGMLRSFAYAAATAKPERPDDWTAAVTDAFMDAYKAAIPGAAGYPKDPAHADALLSLFLFEKALYEVGYELANRPDWVGIPLGGVLELLDRKPASATPALDRLAERVGIELEYQSATGETVHIGEHAKRAMLTVLGHPAADEQEAERRLAALEDAELTHPLPPVLVVKASAGRIDVPVSFTASGARLRWRIAEEGGAREHEGTVKFSDLELLRTGRHQDRAIERRRLVLDVVLPPGYHRLGLSGGGMDEVVMPLIVTPDRCYLPEALTDGPGIWGISAQLYLLRSQDDWGIGDFADLKKLVEDAAEMGAGVIGLNPLHTMFPDNPEHASPYSRPAGST